MKKAIAAGVTILALTTAGCGSKVDRAGTKKIIAEKIKDSGLNAADQKCIVNSIDKYSDNELLALNKDFAKDAKEPSTDAGKKFQGEMTNCARGTMKETVVDSLKKSFPDITATQIDCTNASIDKLSADEFSKMVSGGGGEDFGAKMAQDCKIGT